MEFLIMIYSIDFNYPASVSSYNTLFLLPIVRSEFFSHAPSLSCPPEQPSQTIPSNETSQNNVPEGGTAIPPNLSNCGLSNDEQPSNLSFDQSDFSENCNSEIICKYICTEQAAGVLHSANSIDQFSLLSNNIQSLHGKYQQFTQLLCDLDASFSIIALQEGLEHRT